MEEEEEEKDRLSNLCDDILHQIFYFAGARKAAQASILSKRWRYFWISMPFHNIDVSDFSNDDACTTTTTSDLDDKFLSFVRTFLALRRYDNNKIKPLKLCFEKSDISKPLLKLRIAKLDISKPLKVSFFLDFLDVGKFMFGPGLLELEVCSYGKTEKHLAAIGDNGPEIVSCFFYPWKFYYLHTLEMRNVFFTTKKFDFCPKSNFLVNLSISHCDFKSIKIHRMERLEVIKMWHCRILGGDIQVTAPNLRLLDCRQMRGTFLWTNNFSIISSESINITVHRDVHENVTSSMFGGLHGATNLTISASLLKCLSLQQDFNGDNPTCNNLKHVVVVCEKPIHETGIPEELLQRWPNLETVEMKRKW